MLENFPGLDLTRPITPADVEAGYATHEGFLIENILMIIDRDLQDVPFILNSEQRRLDWKIAQRRKKGLPVKFFIPKARRRGISAYITARFNVKAQSQRNIDGAVVAHRQKETNKLFSKVDYYVRNARGAKPVLGTDSTVEISFPETNSSLGVFTAGSKEVARGLDCNHLHLSEAAFYENPKSLVASLVQTIPGTGEIFVESTGNGQGTWYHRRCLRAWEGKSEYDIIFFPWHESDDCQASLTREQADAILASYPNSEYEEEELEQRFPDLSAARIAWRRGKIEEFDFDIWLFKQEYPMRFEECFIPTSRSYFHRLTDRLDDPRWVQQDKNFALLEGHPNTGLHYALGADVAAGVENDSSTIEILCLETNEQVAEYRSNRIAPNDFANEIEHIGALFGFPLALIEANNHGHVTLDNLVRNEVYPRSQIYWDEQHSTNITEAGHTTNRRTKPLMVGALRTDMAKGLTIYSTALVGECATFEDTLEAAKGAHDDLVIALALANKGIYELKSYQTWFNEADRLPDVHDFSSIFASRNPGNYGQRQPIQSQVGEDYLEPDFSRSQWLSSPGYYN